MGFPYYWSLDGKSGVLEMSLPLRLAVPTCSCVTSSNCSTALAHVYSQLSPSFSVPPPTPPETRNCLPEVIS